MLELIVALGVVLAGILGMLTLILSSINAARRAAEQVVAQNLAREGIELVRSIRDSNWLDPDYDPSTAETWDKGLIDTAPDPDDPTAAPIVSSSGYTDGASVLNYAPNAHGNDGTKIGLRANSYVQPYDPATDVDTHYFRLITFNPICWNNANQEEIVTALSGCSAGYEPVGLAVISEVRWPTTGVFSHKITLEERLYSWRP